MCHITEIPGVKPGKLVAVYLRVQRKDRNRPLFHPETDGMQRSEVRLALSNDFGHTWEKPQKMDFQLPDLIVPGKCIVLPNGNLGIPCEVWHEWDRGFRQGPSSRLILSADSGKSWKRASIMAADVRKKSIYGDPRLTVTADGKLIALFWRYAETGLICRFTDLSADCGESWAEPQALSLEGQISCPVALNDQLSLCVYQKRFGKSAGVRAVISRDLCSSFDAGMILLSGSRL